MLVYVGIFRGMSALLLGMKWLVYVLVYQGFMKKIVLGSELGLRRSMLKRTLLALLFSTQDRRTLGLLILRLF